MQYRQAIWSGLVRSILPLPLLILQDVGEVNTW